MKRSMLFIIILFTMFFLNAPDTEAAIFKDVPSNKYYSKAVEWGYQQKIIAGDGSGYFRPNDYVTHGQFIKMFTEFYGFDSDANKEQPAFKGYYETLQDYSIFFKKTKHNATITRGEIAALIMISQNDYKDRFDFYDRENILADDNKISQYMLQNKLSNGVTLDNVQPFEKYGFYQPLKRADAMQFLFNLHQKKYNQLKITPIAAKELPTSANIFSTFKAPNGVEFHVLSENQAEFSSVFSYNGKIIGGYESNYGQYFEGIEMGKPLVSEELHFNRKMEIAIFMDRHNQDVVHSIYWKSKDRSYQGLIEETLQNNEANQPFLQAIYVELINEFRAKNGEKLLTAHPVLQTTAFSHSVDMATNNYFAHKDLKGTGSWERVRALDRNFNSVGENISWMSPSIFVAHAGWINSYGHRNNMLYEDHKYVGFGSFKGSGEYADYYTVNLGSTFDN